MTTYSDLRQLMLDNYQTNDVEFRRHITAMLDVVDGDVEGFSALDVGHQRDQSLQFKWGHDHDFGSFEIKGQLGDRHLRIIAYFVDKGVLPFNLGGVQQPWTGWPPEGPLTSERQSVLDVGVWTGGTSLLLAAMGATVRALEEVVKYQECIRYLRAFFNAKVIVPSGAETLYQCNYVDLFDYILFAGVLYHVTDPVLALRLMYNALRPNGGRLLIETAYAPELGKQCALLYCGPQSVVDGGEQYGTRIGWNWFIPSLSALRRMLCDVGFDAESVDIDVHGGRAFAVATKGEQRGMCKAGLSLKGVL